MKIRHLSLVIVGVLFAASAYATDSAVAHAHMSRGDYAAAYRELRILAEQGYPVYQNMIARMHAEGKGVAVDKVMAHVWYTLSASQGDGEGIRGRTALEKELSEEDLLTSDRLAREYGELYVAPFRKDWRLK